MPFTVKCPHCNSNLVAQEELIGKEAGCPYCHKPVRVEPPPAARITPPLPPPAEAPPAAGRPVGLSLPQPPRPLPAAPTSPPPAARTGPAPAWPAAPPLPPTVPPVPPTWREDQPVVKGVVLGTVGRHRQSENRLLALAKSLYRGGCPTDASLWLTGLIATAATALCYVAVIHPVRHTYVGGLLAERGWVPYATVWFTFWAAAILAVKLWKLTNQQVALTCELLPEDREVVITPANVELFQQHLSKFPARTRRTFLVTRLQLALEHFRARKNVSEVGAVLNSQADIDSNAVASSYTMLKVFIWSIPILGFIGTVIGISDAVQGFTGSVQTAQDLEVIKKALGQVTTGLAVAFDTTLVSLVLSILIMFPANSLEKAEEDLLAAVDQYCNENLLRRLSEEAPAAGPPATVNVDLQPWLQRLEAVETAIANRLVGGFEDMKEQFREAQQEQIDMLRDLLKTAAGFPVDGAAAASVDRT